MFLQPIANIPDQKTIPLSFALKLYVLKAIIVDMVTTDGCFAIDKDTIIT